MSVRQENRKYQTQSQVNHMLYLPEQNGRCRSKISQDVHTEQ